VHPIHGLNRRQQLGKEALQDPPKKRSGVGQPRELRGQDQSREIRGILLEREARLVAPPEPHELVPDKTERFDGHPSLAAHEDTIAEARGLSWLFKTRYILDETLIRLGLPTIKLARGDIETYGSWEKLSELSNESPDDVFEALEIILKHELKADYAYIPVEDVLPTLRTVLRAGKTETKTRAKQLINRLGEKGYLQFGDLLINPASDD